LTSNCRRRSAIGTAVSRPYTATAALFTQVSIRPNSWIAVSAMRSTSSGTATSATAYVARPPALRIPSTARRRSLSLRAAKTTRAPREAAIFAVIRPMPLEAPVITMT
jgi:hypothetical protein